MLQDERRHNELIVVSLFVFGIILSILFISLAFNDHFFLEPKDDAEKYYRMSYDVFEKVGGNQQGRILVPFLVYLLPIDHYAGFGVVNLISLFLLGILFYYYIKKLNFGRIEAFAGVLLLLLSPTMIYTIRNICLVDIPSFLFILIAFYAMLIRNEKLYLIILIIGVLNKETILLTLPVYFFYRLSNSNAITAFKSTTIVAIPALILFAAMKIFLQPPPVPAETLIKAVFAYYKSVGPLYLMSQTYMPFGSLWLLNIANLKQIDNLFLKVGIYIMTLVVLIETTILGGTDIFRIIFILFPIIIPISLYSFKIKYPSVITYSICFVTILFMIVSIIYIIHSVLTEVGTFSAYYSNLFQILVLTILVASQLKNRDRSFKMLTP
jgi:hypothetical protein